MKILILTLLAFVAFAPVHSEELSPLGKLTNSAEECLSQYGTDQRCLKLHHCKTPIFVAQFGPIEGAGRGCCNSSSRSFWQILLRRANERFSACLKTKEIAQERFDILASFYREKQAFDDFRNAKCNLIKDINWPYTPFAFELGIQCRITSNRDRIVELDERTNECKAK